MEKRKLKIQYLKALAAGDTKEAETLKKHLNGKIIHCETFFDLMKLDENQINNPDIEITLGKELHRAFENIEAEKLRDTSFFNN